MTTMTFTFKKVELPVPTVEELIDGAWDTYINMNIDPSWFGFRSGTWENFEN